MGTTTQHPRLLPLPQRIIRYPPSAKRPRLRTMVKPTLKTMLSTIQNRQPLPKGNPLSRSAHLHLEHHVLLDRFQIGQGLHLSVRVSEFYGVLQRLRLSRGPGS